MAFFTKSNGVSKNAPKIKFHKNKQKIQHKFDFLKSITKFCTQLANSKFKITHSNFYLKTKTWLIEEHQIFEVLELKNISIKTKINFIIKLTKNKFYYKILNNYNNEFFKYILNDILKNCTFSSYLNLKPYYELLLDYITSSYKNYLVINSDSYLYNLQSLNFYFYFYSKLNFYFNFYNINNEKIKIKKKVNTPSKAKFLALDRIGNRVLGFKMQLIGRFSRKQRASSLWFKDGYLPLNSINTNIDFAFYTIALTNSSINVKVWIYKGEKPFDWHLNII